MASVALTLLGGGSVSVDADDATDPSDLPAALLPAGVAAGCRLFVDGRAYDVQGSAATVAATLDAARMTSAIFQGDLSAPRRWVRAIRKVFFSDLPPFAAVVAGSGASVSVTDAALAALPFGGVRFYPGTTTTGSAKLANVPANFRGQYARGVILSGLFLVDTLASAAENFTFDACAFETGAGNDGCGFRYRGDGFPNWQAWRRVGGVDAYIDTGIAVVAGTVRRMDVRWTPTEVRWYIDGALVATAAVAISINAAFVWVGRMTKSAGTGVRFCWCPMFELYVSPAADWPGGYQEPDA